MVGLKMYVIIQKWFRIEPAFVPETGLSNLIGLAAMSPIIGIYHLFFPIALPLHLFFIALVLGNWKHAKLIFTNLRSEIIANKLQYILLFVVAVVSVCIRPGRGDIADYHLQAIRWAENYSNIIGLGNFNRPLANNNWWFNLQAFFGFRFLGVESVYIGNALIFMALFLFMYNPNNKLNKSGWFIWIQLGFLVLCVKTAFVGSVTPDFIITCLVMVTAILFERYFIQQMKLKGYLICIFILSCFALTVKLNAFPLLFIASLALWELIQKQLKHINLYKSILLASVFLIPWLIGNIIASGWLVYPVDSLDLFHVDWKVPKEILQFERFSIKQWGKNPGADIYLTSQLSFFQWLPKWFAYHDLFNKVFIIASVIAITYLILSKQNYQNKARAALVFFGVAGLLFCLSNGPHIRYSFGYMILLIALATQSIMGRLKFETGTVVFKVLQSGLLVLVLFQGIVFCSKQTLQTNLMSILKPKSYPVIPLTSQPIGSQQAIITNQNNSCWDQFPCSYYMIEGCTLRGNTFKTGFKINPEMIIH